MVPACWVLLAGLAMAYGSAGAIEGTRPSPIPVVEIPAEGDPNGELALCDHSGKVIRRYTGLGHPVHLIRSGTDTVFVTDRTGGRILELDLEGRVHWAWRAPPDLHGLSSVIPTPGGSLFVVTEHQGFFEIDPDGDILWRAPRPPEITKPINRAIPLPDGSILVVARDRKQPFFRMNRQGHTTHVIPLPVDQSHCNMPHVMPWTLDGSEFVLWDNDWNKTYLARWTGQTIETTGTLPLPHRLLEVAPDGRGGCAFVLGALRAGVWSPGSEIQQFYTVFQPLGITAFPDRKQVMIAYRRLEPGSWPGSLPSSPSKPRLDWLRFGLWIIGAFLLAAALHVPAYRWESRRVRDKPEKGSDTEAVSKDTSPVAKPDSASPRSRKRNRILAAVTFLAAVLGLVLTVHGYRLMRNYYQDGWLTNFVSGALLATLAIESWRRLGLRERDPFWSATLQAQPRMKAWPFLLVSSLIALTGSGLLYLWCLEGGNYTDQVGLWGSLIVLLLSMTFMPIQVLRSFKNSWSRIDLLFLLIAFGTGSITFFYRLGEIPSNFHGDSVSYSLIGYGLRAGWYERIWNHAGYPWPAIGNIPEAIGISLVGFGRTGVRLGSVLLCLTAIPAVYLLGRTYRDRRVGLLAALFLAGSTPFMHFARVTYPGEAATLGLWVITFFALAVRHGHPGLWILAGLAAGWCFYVYPVARVAPISVFLLGIVIALRAPRRVTLPRWFGPLLLALAAVAILTPVFPTWQKTPAGPLARVEEAVAVYKPGEGINWNHLKGSLGTPLFQSFGWFFTVPDQCSQSSLSPGCNAVESVLLAIGIGIALVEGFSLNVLLLGYMIVDLILCGAWANNTTFYMRLLPTIAVAALLMARCVTGFLDFFPPTPKWLRIVLFFLAAVGTVAVSPFANLRRYTRYEIGEGGRPVWEMTAIGRRLEELGPGYDYYMVITGRSDWSCDFSRRTARLHEMLPLVWNLHLEEVRDLSTRLPFPENRPAGVIVQGRRADQDVPLLKEWYPNAKVEEIRGGRDQLFAVLVLIEKKEDN